MTRRIRPARDQALLDRADAHPYQSFTRRVWRVVHEGRDALEPSRAGGRWDLGAFDALYTAYDPDGAIAEVDYHLSMHPVFPSLYRARLHQIEIRIDKVAVFQTLDDLVPFGVDIARYEDPLYETTQEIGDAFAFLGHGALVAPNARWPCLNIAIFTEAVGVSLTSVDEQEVDIQEWHARNLARRKGPRSIS
ncbi:MAG: RES family NAD+ phosphorylase [Burkholderiales bacterium]